MRFVVDASVAIKWFVAEPGRDVARSLLSGEHMLFAPDLVYSEVANGIHRKMRRGEIDPPQAATSVQQLLKAPWRTIPTERLVAPAFVIASLLQHSVYDCCYLAAAVAEQAVLVTADEAFASKVANTGHRDSVLALSELASALQKS